MSQPPCVDLTAREARYLLELLGMARDEKAPTQAQLARSVGVSQPTALEMVRRLRELGLVAAEGLELTNEGTSAALVLASRQRAAHLLAHNVLGLDGAQADEEAARLAPNLSSDLMRRILASHQPRN
jgi:Mn-dependent DtxR family transcriptional regulator